MSPSVQLSVLALASSALAAGQHNRHAHLHRAAPAPYPVPGGNNSTGNAWPSSGAPGTDTCTESATPPSYPSPSLSAYPSPSGYVSPAGYPSPSGYASPSGYPSPSGYASPSGYPSPSGYASPSGYPSPSGYTSPVGYSSPSGYPSPSGSAPGPWSSWVPGTCAPVTVTATGGWTVTVTVTAGESPSPYSSAPAPPSYGSESSPSAYEAPSPATSVTAAAINAYTPPASASTVSVSPVPVSSATSTPSSSSSKGSGKRGLAYNNAGLTSGFMGKSEITWAYNWGSTPNGLGSGVQFIPLLHDGSSMFTDVWSVDAQTAINAGAKTLFAFNEPDAPSQANMSPADAAQVYMSYMQPFAGKAALCAPAVTNGEYTATGLPMGLNWLKEFLAECSGCTIDCLNIHWYASGPTAVQNFQDHLSQTAALAPGKSIWVSEFALSGASPEDQSTFMETVMPMMDNNSDVAGYAYYWVDGVLVEGSEPSNPIGTTYMSFA